MIGAGVEDAHLQAFTWYMHYPPQKTGDLPGQAGFSAECLDDVHM
jgi:hypothetical protein